ncbi:hypothetical protein HQ393_11475 [Chitinibacter bivalviorum]|uniref:Uncharacterized protein n=1 Tax=Chitinibacter bivalviorum TaxID=2739434 RepID=A0A7H9BKB1_9NEIS|nr:hypothetical protein [Chitinibacter bivalviorum]QLG88802.1 hypothetical protein HQ393_11475 [Chitinibacter bivalviorum]
MKSIVLLLTHERLGAYQWGHLGAEDLARFSHDEAGIAEFKHWLSQQELQRYYLLTDLVEEDLQHEMVPHLNAKDQRALQERKLDQLFRATPYRRARIQLKGKRGEQDRLQLSALTSREQIDRILAELNTVKAAVAGVYSVSLLTQDMMAKLHSDLPHILVMSSCEAGQLRQSYFTPDGLRFSRLGTFNPEQEIALQAAEVANEIRRARQYLTTLRLMGREEQLTIFALFDSQMAAERETIWAALGDDAGQIDFSVQTDLQDLAKRLKLPKACHTWLDILVAMLVTQRPVNQYAPAEAIKYNGLYILGKGLFISAFIVLVCACILSGLSYFQAGQLQGQLAAGERRQQQLQQRQRQYSSLLKQVAASEPARLQAAVKMYREHIEFAPNVEALLRQISQILLDFPTLTLDEVKWAAGSDVSAEGTPVAPASQQDAAAAADPNAQPGGTPWLSQTLQLSGRVQDPNAYRAALAQVNALMQRLQLLPQAQVTVLQWPIDIRSESSIKAQADRSVSDEKGRHADFVIRLHLPAPTVPPQQELAP